MPTYWNVQGDFDAYRSNPFPKDLEDRLHGINNDLSAINKYVKDVKRNLEGLQTIASKNESLATALNKEIIALESKLADIAGMLAESGIHKNLTSVRDQFRLLQEQYTTHEAIRRQRYQDYIMQASYPPWDIIYDKVCSLDGDLHVIGEEISSFIVPSQYQEEFLDFVEGLPNFQYRGPAPKIPNSYMIRYRKPAESRYRYV